MYNSFRAICYCKLVPNDLNFLKFHHIEGIGSQLNLLIQRWSGAWLQFSCRIMAVGWEIRNWGHLINTKFNSDLPDSHNRMEAFVQI